MPSESRSELLIDNIDDNDDNEAEEEEEEEDAAEDDNDLELLRDDSAKCRSGSSSSRWLSGSLTSDSYSEIL